MSMNMFKVSYLIKACFTNILYQYTDGIAPAGNPLLAFISCLYDMHGSSILLTPKQQGECYYVWRLVNDERTTNIKVI